MTDLAFLDSGIFIAFLNRRDRWHSAARALFAEPQPRWATSLLVISETYSWQLHKMGEEAARTFLSLISNLEGLRIYPASLDHHDAIRRMLDRLRGTKLSYVDASSLCLLEKHRIRTVWATDRHLGLAGAELLPRV